MRVADLPEVKAAFRDAAETISALRVLLEAWEPHVRCAQCGERYRDRACGPTHATVTALIWPVPG